MTRLPPTSSHAVTADKVSATHAHVLRLIERHGRNAMAFQALDPGYQYFFDGDHGCMPYADTGAAWIATGNPIAPAHALATIIERFGAAATAAGKRWCIFGADDELRQACGGAVRPIAIGVQPEWNPQRWAATVQQHRSIREQLRRASAKHVTIRHLASHELADPAMQQALHNLAAAWLATRPLPAMGFLVQLELRGHPERRQVFVARQAGAIVGLANVVPVPARPGWFIKDVLRLPNAPNGTSELLIDAVMRWAANNHCAWVTLGLAPLAGEVVPSLRWARHVSNRLYNFEGVYQFKAKLRPAAEPTLYLLHPPARRAPRYMLDAITAFAPGGLWRFGWQAWRRDPMLPLRLGQRR